MKSTRILFITLAITALVLSLFIRHRLITKSDKPETSVGEFSDANLEVSRPLVADGLLQPDRNAKSAQSSIQRFSPTAILRANSKGPEALQEFVLKLLEDDEGKALLLIADLEYVDADHDAISEALFEFYIGNARYADGLAAFDILDQNLTLVTPILHRFATAYYHEDPEAALKWVQLNSSKNGIEEAVRSIGELSGQSKEPGIQLGAFLASDPQLDIAKHYLKGAVESWMQEDLEGAFQFVLDADLPPYYYDSTIYIMSTEAVKVDPASAVDWSLSIVDQGLRYSALVDVVDQWRNQSLDAYEEWISEQSPKLQNEIRKIEEVEF